MYPVTALNEVLVFEPPQNDEQTGAPALTLAEVVHEARNLLSALTLYCDLLSEPGVLSKSSAHYSRELRLVASAGHGLVEKLAGLRQSQASRSIALQPLPTFVTALPGTQPHAAPDWLPSPFVTNLAEELRQRRTLLSAMAGPLVRIKMALEGGAKPVAITGEDLTRVLVNLIRNAAQAMGGSGTISFTLSRSANASSLRLAVEDTGPGIPPEDLETIFVRGYTTQASGSDRGAGGAWPVLHRGLGLAITRSILEAAGGRIRALNRPQGGARFEIELPIRCVAHNSSAPETTVS